MKIYNVYKPLGKTPLEALLAFRKKKRLPKTSKLAYAGRLDPMASGVLLILENAAQKEWEKKLSLDKSYRVQILLGISTDSYDILGLPALNKTQIKNEKSAKRDALIKTLRSYLKPTLLPVPPYSSVPHNGKPLFEWARMGKIKTEDLPKRTMLIKNIKLTGIKTITSKKLLKTINSAIKKVKGDFRQKNILKAWQNLLSASDATIPDSKPGTEKMGFLPLKISNQKPKNFGLIKIEISCASGTYIRSLAFDIGKKLKTGALVFSLKRLSAGKYKLKNSIRI